MPKSLLEQLPEIVAKGRQQAEKILESIEGRHRVQLQTREIVLPAKDAVAQDWITSQHRQVQRASVSPLPQAGEGPGESGAASPRAQAGEHPEGHKGPGERENAEAPWTNRLIYGDNLLAMAALLAGDDRTPSLRGKVDLIYIDPPFDSKADYRTKVVLPSPASGGGAGGEGKSVELEQKPTVIEQFAYSDTWSDGTASYLAMITPRLILMRELLADTGSIYVHLDWHVGHYVKVVMDEIFGKDNFLNEIIWKRTIGGTSIANRFRTQTDSLFLYAKSSSYVFSEQYTKTNLTDEEVLEKFPLVDPARGRYCTDNLANPDYRPNLMYEYNGYKPPVKGWAISLQKMGSSRFSYGRQTCSRCCEGRAVVEE